MHACMHAPPAYSCAAAVCVCPSASPPLDDTTTCRRRFCEHRQTLVPKLHPSAAEEVTRPELLLALRVLQPAIAAHGGCGWACNAAAMLLPRAGATGGRSVWR